MIPQSGKTTDEQPSRRQFIKTGSSLLVAGGVVGSSLSLARAAHPFGSDTIKIGLIGCGGRGTKAAIQAMNTSGGDVKIIAMGDIFPERLAISARSIKGAHPNKFDVPKERQFLGLESYKDVLATDVDFVILTTPPGFRPLHFEAAVKADKHIFMEKPVATDAPGVRRVLEANEEAKKKSLAVAVGLQRRHEPRYIETMKLLHEGKIGDVILSRAYWNGQTPWVRPRKEDQSELEYQMYNWYYFTWVCGDHIVEQHIHNLDVINWLKQGYPVEAQGQGGCEVRKGIDHGETFDHHMIEFTYADGSKMLSQCRHISNCWRQVSEHAHGTNGYADISGQKIYDAEGNLTWSYGRGGGNGHQQEHHDLFAELRAGRFPNEGEYGALSTMTAIFGRMATYSGQKISWEDALNSNIQLADVDKFVSFDLEPPVKPNEDGWYRRAIPGQAKVI